MYALSLLYLLWFPLNPRRYAIPPHDLPVHVPGHSYKEAMKNYITPTQEQLAFDIEDAKENKKNASTAARAAKQALKACFKSKRTPKQTASVKKTPAKGPAVDGFNAYCEQNRAMLAQRYSGLNPEQMQVYAREEWKAMDRDARSVYETPTKVVQKRKRKTQAGAKKNKANTNDNVPLSMQSHLPAEELAASGLSQLSVQQELCVNPPAAAAALGHLILNDGSFASQHHAQASRHDMKGGGGQMLAIARLVFLSSSPTNLVQFSIIGTRHRCCCKLPTRPRSRSPHHIPPGFRRRPGQSTSTRGSGRCRTRTIRR